MNFVPKAQRLLISFGFLLGAIALNSLPAKAETANAEASSKKLSQIQLAQPTALSQNSPTSVAAADLMTESLSVQTAIAPAAQTGSASPFVLAQTAPAPQPESAPPAPAEAPPSILPADPTPADSPAPGTEPFLTRQVQRRYLSNYIGVGANLGLTGETPLSETNFTIYSKIQVSPSFSARPGIIIGDNVQILLPVTYDFSRVRLGEGEIPRAVPFLGGGITVTTGDTSEVDLLLTGGIDIPLSRQLTATATLNLAPFNSFDVGVLLGVAYTFDSRTSIVRAAAVNPEFQRPVRPNPSYIGIGGNIGISGSSALGNSSFAAFGKISLTDYASIRPTVLIEDDATVLLGATYDFPLVRTEFISLAPYLGAGISFSTGDDSTADALLTGGIDIPITSRLAATAAINITPFDGFDWGAMVGLAYTFGSF